MSRMEIGLCRNLEQNYWGCGAAIIPSILHRGICTNSYLILFEGCNYDELPIFPARTWIVLKNEIAPALWGLLPSITNNSEAMGNCPQLIEMNR